MLFLYEGNQPFAQVAPRRSGGFILGDIKKLSGNIPGQVVLGDPVPSNMSCRGPSNLNFSVIPAVHMASYVHRIKGFIMIHAGEHLPTFAEELPSLTTAPTAFCSPHDKDAKRCVTISLFQGKVLNCLLCLVI